MAKIMLVEDDPMIAEIYKKKFEAEGFEVVNAVTGKEVLKYASEQYFDLILLDMVLPEISGMDVLKELKHSGNYNADLKVVVFSNLSKADHEKTAMNNGADGYIGKTDYSPSELVVEIKRLLNEYSEQKRNNQRMSGEASTDSSDKKKILLIEDEDVFIDMFGKKLEDEGYVVDVAKNGSWGLKQALANSYDLIITDMVMPAMGGFEIIARLKDEDSTKNVPIVVISASLVSEDIERVKQLDVAGFFEKTRVIPSELARKVKEILK